MKALCIVAHCPVCRSVVRLLPGSEQWRCVEYPYHHDEAHCSACGTTFDPDESALSMEAVEVDRYEARHVH
jgi:hypothetical protein